MKKPVFLKGETLYTLQKCTKEEGKIYGISHGSKDANYTICGREIDSEWCITNNEYSGGIDCPECIKILLKKKRNKK